MHADFRALAQSLGGRPFIGHDGYYHIADFTIDQIRARAGTRGTVQRIGGHVMLQFRVVEGTAVILGAQDATGVLRDCDILLVDDPPPPGADRRTRRISRMPPLN